MAWTSHSGPALDVEALHRETAQIQAWLASESHSSPSKMPEYTGIPKLGSHGTSSINRAFSSQATPAFERAGRESAGGAPQNIRGESRELELLEQENRELRSEVHAVYAGEEMLGAEVEAERLSLEREHNELERRLELALEQQRTLAACTEAESAELESQHGVAATRLCRLAETEVAMKEQHAVDERCRSQELAELREELEATRARHQAAAAAAEAEVLALREENEELSRRLAEAASERSAADVTGVVEERARQREFAELSQELGGRARRVQALQDKLARVQRDSAELESQLSRESKRPSPADMGAQRDVLRVLTQTVRRLKPAVQAAKLERADLEESVRVEQACAEQLRFQDGHAGSQTELAVQALRSAQQQLANLRGMYTNMQRNCEDLGDRLAQSPERGDPSGALSSQAGGWDDVVLSAREEAALARDSEEIMRLNDELRVAEMRRASVRDEEARLIEAARMDRAAVQDLQEHLRRSEARNAELEAQLAPWGSVLDQSF